MAIPIVLNDLAVLGISHIARPNHGRRVNIRAVVSPFLIDTVGFRTQKALPSATQDPAGLLLWNYFAGLSKTPSATDSRS